MNTISVLSVVVAILFLMLCQAVINHITYDARMKEREDAIVARRLQKYAIEQVNGVAGLGTTARIENGVIYYK